MAEGGEHLARTAGDAYDRIALDILEDIEAEGRYTIVYPDAAELDEYQQRYAPLHDEWAKATENGEAAYALALEVLEELRAEHE